MATSCRALDEDGNVIAEATGHSNNSNSEAVERNSCLMKLNSRVDQETWTVDY